MKKSFRHYQEFLIFILTLTLSYFYHTFESESTSSSLLVSLIKLHCVSCHLFISDVNFLPIVRFASFVICHYFFYFLNFFWFPWNKYIPYFAAYKIHCFRLKIYKSVTASYELKDDDGSLWYCWDSTIKVNPILGSWIYTNVSKLTNIWEKLFFLNWDAARVKPA